MRLIDAENIRIKPEFMHDVCGMAMIRVEDVVRILNEQSTIQPEPHWIPVTEDTLPEEGRIVVVHGEKGTWDYGKYRGYGTNIHYWYWKNKTFKKVYWWMYKEDALPEPYKGVTE